MFLPSHSPCAWSHSVTNPIRNLWNIPVVIIRLPQMTSSGNYYQLHWQAQLFHRCAAFYRMIQYTFSRDVTPHCFCEETFACSSPIPLPPVSGTLDALTHLLSLAFLWWHIVQHLHHLSKWQIRRVILQARSKVPPGWGHAASVLL